jgi:hypothetical protein
LEKKFRFILSFTNGRIASLKMPFNASLFVFVPVDGLCIQVTHCTAVI